MQKQLCGNRFSPFMEKMFDWDFGQSVPIQESPRGAGVRRGTGLVPPPLPLAQLFAGTVVSPNIAAQMAF